MRHWIAAALVMTAGVMTAAAPAGADVKAGVDAWAKGDWNRAVEEWRGPAIAGDADAQFNLAQAYKLGRGVPVDPALAESWFRKAAMQGHRQAEDNYGLALFQADKKADALPWLEKSVARFEPRAQLVLGTMLFNGDGVKRDYPRAYALMTRASAAGLESAGQTLAQMDQYIAPADRERGIALARQYEAQARAAPTGRGTGGGALVDQTARRGAASAVAAAPVGRTPKKAAAGAAPKPAPVEAAGPAAAATTPAARKAVAAKPSPAAGKWRVQLGAFRDRANAEGLWRQVSGKLRGATPAYVTGGGVTRLQASGYTDRADAVRACAAVRGVPCVVVAP